MSNRWVSLLCLMKTINVLPMATFSLILLLHTSNVKALLPTRCYHTLMIDLCSWPVELMTCLRKIGVQTKLSFRLCVISNMQHVQINLLSSADF